MFFYCFTGIVLFQVISVDASRGTGLVDIAGWSYNKDGPLGPSNWTKVDARCGGSKQSPINVKVKDVSFDHNYTSPAYKNYDKVLNGTKFTFANNGHSVKVTIDIPAIHRTQNVTLFDNVWVPWQFHLHWGANNMTGSEHTIDSKIYPLEVHMVHENAKYFPNVTKCLENSDGLLVMATLFEIGDEDATIKKLIDHFKDVSHNDDAVDIAPFKLSDVLPKNSESYYHYNGSLTTPDCQEVVSWVIFKDKRQISTAQIDKFRTVLYQTKKQSNKSILMTHNYRHTQPLNGRTVFGFSKYEELNVPSGSQSLLPISLFFFFLPALYMFMN